MKTFSAALRYSRTILIPPVIFSTLSHYCSAASAAIVPGDLLITEVMANPAAVSDTNGEWFEIYNTTDSVINLSGLVLRDNGSNQHTISAADKLFVSGGSYFVLGRNGDSNSNGGYLADYTYSNFSLGNTADDIILEFDNTVIASLIYNDSLFGTAGNSVEWNRTNFTLTPDTYVYGDGDIGTPGRKGSTDPVAAVPIPAAGWLMATAISSLMVIRRNRQQR